ncbi:hypothetical protein BVRB_6g141620 [Beta vulgaris subsp. vulgaris]|nr:hypothetical protein BVRB_6g141620 [Beta vulgaris subsp. vulgaris]
MRFLGPHQISPLKRPKKNGPQVTTQELQPNLSSLTSLTIHLSSHSLSSSNSKTQPLLFSSPQRHQQRHFSLHLILFSPETPPAPSSLSSFPHLFTSNATPLAKTNNSLEKLVSKDSPTTMDGGVFD